MQDPVKSDRPSVTDDDAVAIRLFVRRAVIFAAADGAHFFGYLICHRNCTSISGYNQGCYIPYTLFYVYLRVADAVETLKGDLDVVSQHRTPCQLRSRFRGLNRAASSQLASCMRVRRPQSVRLSVCRDRIERAEGGGSPFPLQIPISPRPVGRSVDAIIASSF